MKVFDDAGVQKTIKKYKVEKQYKKACGYIERGNYKVVDLKLRKPKHLGIYQFRITQKYRAFAFKDEDCLVVYKISGHQ